MLNKEFDCAEADVILETEAVTDVVIWTSVKTLRIPDGTVSDINSICASEEADINLLAENTGVVLLSPEEEATTI